MIEAGLWGDTLATADESRHAVRAIRRRGTEIAGDVPNPVRVLAALEGSGVDQPVYVRGSHKAPGEVAVRSFISPRAGDPPWPAEYEP